MLPDAEKQDAFARTEEAVVPDLDESLWEYVLEESANEFFSSDGAVSVLACGRVSVAEGNGVVIFIHGDNAIIADGNPKNVRGKILQGRCAGANWLAVRDPFLDPNVRRDEIKRFGGS